MTNKDLEKELSYEKKSSWKGKTEEALNYARGYKEFLKNKTERECVTAAVKLARANGYTDLYEKIDSAQELFANDKVYAVYQNKCVVLVKIGTAPFSEGLNIAAAHIDAPRIDLKAVPLFEDANLAMMKTHYYGGIKKYQWTALPLSMHGVIYNQDGEKIDVSIGEDKDDPVFYISDLLVHLAADQMQKKALEVILGEQLNLIVGNIPLEDEDISKQVKFNVLKYLFDKYKITEKSFLSAEIEIVPAGEARDVGFDRSMISAYGHDDRVCAYPALTGILDTGETQRTSVCILCDKEEIGSFGSTGLQSKFFENIISEIYNLTHKTYKELDIKRALANSYVLSMDVTAGYDPNFPDAFEKGNTSIMGCGATVSKYGGARGKSGSNDAHSEYMFKLLKQFDENGVVYQTGELGKVDQGGGGTVAYILANYGAHTVDYGVAVLSMHAPYELISKADLYSCYEGAKAFYKMK